MTVRVIHGDSRHELRRFDAASFAAVVTDPPYGLGFMGRQWDTGQAAFDPAFWREVLRVLKPGAHLIAFGGTRTFHRLAVAIEDAGFDVRDTVAWLYGSGFPKSHNIGKAIDRAAGVEREIVGQETLSNDIRSGALLKVARGERGPNIRDRTIATSSAARQWDGWGTALKPAWEPIVLARKPLIGTVAANVQQHGTGAMNIDGCRVEAESDRPWRQPSGIGVALSGSVDGTLRNEIEDRSNLGRWPANVIHDGSEEVVAAFPETGPGYLSGETPSMTGLQRLVRNPVAGLDSGSAARFFYTAKADAGDRLGSKHPTVKPVDLMAYLCRLVTPQGGTVLDPFAGSGTTGMACLREGFDCILIEREAEYVADIHRRLDHVAGADTPLFAASNQ